MKGVTETAYRGSQNETLQKQGLGLLISPDLSAFIPTNRLDAENVHWGAMPYDAILTGLASMRLPRRMQV